MYDPGNALGVDGDFAFGHPVSPCAISGKTAYFPVAFFLGCDRLQDVTVIERNAFTRRACIVLRAPRLDRGLGELQMHFGARRCSGAEFGFEREIDRGPFDVLFIGPVLASQHVGRGVLSCI